MPKITVAYFRKHFVDYMGNKITMSKFVELLNDKLEDNSICRKCKKEFDEHTIKGIGLCTACFTNNA